MKEFIIQIIIGVSLIVIGMSNMKGNVSLIHSYHRKRVKKEDIIPFGRKVGIGSIIIGITIIISGTFTILNYSIISNIILAFGLINGTIMIFYAILKYNKVIF